MLSYLFKRVLYLVPALWLIGTLVFCISRALPPDLDAIVQENSSYYGSSNAASRQEASKAYLRRTGQDLPLFYISLRSKIEPDTLHLIYPETEREFLSRLNWHYGNWHLVTSYYQGIESLDRSLSDSDRKTVQPLLDKLMYSKEPADLLAVTAALTTALTDSAAVTQSRALNARAKAMTARQPDYTYLLPRLHWNGTFNQYHVWFTQLLKGDFGYSFRDGRPVVQVIGESVLNTFALMLISMLLTATIALELSLLMVQEKSGWLRRTLLPVLFIIDSIPTFVLALLLLVLLANPSFLQLFPVYGSGYYHSGPNDRHLQFVRQVPYMVLPILCLVLANLPYLTNQVYSSIAGVLQADYIRTAKAKGLSSRVVIRKHVLRNALLPIITLLSDFLPALVAGAVIIETIFAVPGVGILLIKSVIARDHAVIVMIIMLIAVLKAVSHLIADLLYGLADPRIRFSTT